MSKIPSDNRMPQSIKALFTAKGNKWGSRPPSFHIPREDLEKNTTLCAQGFAEITGPPRYGPYCSACKSRYYTSL